MKILISLRHPAHYFLFKFVYKKLVKKGHEVDITIKQKDILENLLISDGIPYTKTTNRIKTINKIFIILSRVFELIKEDYGVFKLVRKKKYDLLIGSDIGITHVGKIFNIPSIVFNEDDYEINKSFCKLSYPFATYIMSPEMCSVGNYIKKKISYNGIQKMAYLNIKYFIPDIKIIEKYKLNLCKYFIIRLVSLTAAHDIEGKHKGLGLELLDKIIFKLKDKGKIVISSEEELPYKYNQYRLKLDPIDMHHIMAFADLFIGDSQSMCAEAGILGCPFIRYNDFVGKIGYLNELENKYNLGFGVKTHEPQKLFEIINTILSFEDIKKEWQNRKSILFKDKIDPTSFFVWFIENYPASAKVLKRKPDYQNNFK